MEKFYSKRLSPPNQSGFSDLLNYKCFVDNGIIYHEDANQVFQKSYWIKGFDFESAEEGEIAAITSYLNLIFAGIPTGWVIAVNNIRMEDNGYLDSHNNHFNNNLLALIDKEREYYFTQQATLFKSVTAITFTYVAQQKSVKKLAKLFVSSTKQKTIPKTFDLCLEEFKQQLELFQKLLSRGLRLSAMTDNETVSYLNYLISGKWIKFKLPAKSYVDLRFLLGEEYISGLEPKIGSNQVRVIAIDNYFPDESNPLMLERLNNLGFCFRWHTRFFFLTKLEAQKNISYLSDLHEQEINGIKGATLAHTALGGRKYNRAAEYFFEQTEAALASTMISNVNYGKYSCNIVLHHCDEQVINEQRNTVVSLLEEMGYKARDERLNSQEAFLSTIDGNIYNNRRRSLISTENLADLLPLSGFWHGHNHHPSQLYPQGSNPLFMVDTNNYQSFRGNLFVNDVGHTLIIGKSGAGKSTLVNFLIASHMRYPNAQFFGFDNKHSMLALTYGVNGCHYDIGNDATSFQPLATIDTASGLDFATNWLEGLCTLNNVSVTADIIKAINITVQSLSILERQHRTLKNLYLQAKGLNPELANLISLYMAEDSLQGRIFAATQDQIQLNSFNVFELSELQQKGEKALIPTLKYLFYKIMSYLDGRPTLIVIEEAWMAFASPVFAKQLDEWLKTLRKLNVYIIMVTLQVNEIIESPIKSTLLNQCASIIYTPNPDLKKAEVYRSYKNFGLTDKQIDLIRTAQLKKEYYLVNSDGERMFNLDMNYFEIAQLFFCKTSKQDSLKAKQIKANANNNFAEAWLQEHGIHDIKI